MGEGRLLAGHVAVRRAAEAQRHRVDTPVGPLVQCLLHRPGRLLVAGAHADLDCGRPDGPRRQHRAVEHQMGRAGRQGSVLAAGRLALHQVGHHHRTPEGGAPPRELTEGGEFATGREPGAATAEQPGPVHRLHEASAPLPVVATGQRRGSESIEMRIEARLVRTTDHCRHEPAR